MITWHYVFAFPELSFSTIRFKTLTFPVFCQRCFACVKNGKSYSLESFWKNTCYFHLFLTKNKFRNLFRKFFEFQKSLNEIYLKKVASQNSIFFDYFWIIQILHYVCHFYTKQMYKKEWNWKMICKFIVIIFAFITLFGQSRRKKANRISFITLRAISSSKCIFYFIYIFIFLMVLDV